MVALSVALAPRAAGAQESRDLELREARRVTAVDTLVELDGGWARKTLAGRFARPARIDLEDFTVLLDGRPRPVVGVAPLAGLDHPASEAEPWSFLVYVDLTTTDLVQSSWAVDQLLARTGELTRLGTVEVVLADPEPRLLVPATRDPETLDRALAGLVLQPRGEDQLGALRSDLAAVLGRAEDDRTALATAALADETRSVERLHDDLALTLTATARESGPGRVVFLVSGGHDLAPEVFYGGDSLAYGPGSFVAPTARLGETLAAYGWKVVPVLAPPLPGLLEGLRIGKLRFARVGGLPGGDAGGLYALGHFLGATAVYEEDRDPKAARAFLELGRARLGQGKLEDAAHSLGKALFHFKDDPATAEEQAEAYLLLARIFERQEEPQRARLAIQRAAVRAPEAVEAAGHASADAPGLPGLALLARTTGGAVVRSPQELGAMLERLGRHLRLTFQLEGLPDGRLHELEVRRTRRATGNWDVQHVPRLIRSATPTEVVDARLRELVTGRVRTSSGAGGQGDLAAALAVAASPGGAPPALVIDALAETSSGRAAGEPAAVLRASLAYPTAPGELAVEHLGPIVLPRADDGAIASPSQPLSLAPPPGAELAFVVVEDLVTGSWTTEVLELPTG